MAGRKGTVESQRRSDTVAVLPRLELAAVGVAVTHASAKPYAAQVSKEAGRTAARAERTKRTLFRKDVPDHAASLVVHGDVQAHEQGGCTVHKSPCGHQLRVAQRARVHLYPGKCSCCTDMSVPSHQLY